MREKLSSHLWNWYAPIYDILTNRYLKETRQEYLSILLNNNELDKNIRNLLIIGAGTGECLTMIPQEVIVTAIDYSEEMLKRAQTKIQTGQIVNLFQMDAHQLKFSDNEFQTCLLTLVLTVVENPKTVLEEAVRVLSPGGRLLIFDKLLLKNESPSLLRKLVAPFLKFVATDVQLRIFPLLENLPVKILYSKSLLFGGWFKILLLQKINN